ncbi:Tfp pilus assembly pilus retraction ATPase PilT [Roseateles asaccharophilus]|uniref:ATPase, T2SS/T4P/T4SS family n=1 Tax=Roseateles asaccharophilus TaxID=582607 RepID=UPI003838E0C0
MAVLELELAVAQVTDWFIPEDGDEFLVYPGAIKAHGELLTFAKELRKDCAWRRSQDANPPDDWQTDVGELSFRVHRQVTVAGTLYILRKVSKDLPVLASLGIPEEIVQILSWKRFGEGGGLVVICGSPGHGKSTTCSAVILERVKAFGYFALTVEDPPEFAMQGEYLAKNGTLGQIIQVPAKSDTFASELRAALRCYPANMRGSMLMVGEIRDGEAAAQLLRAALNGQLVFATVHANSASTALERILAMAKETMGDEVAQSLLSASLRAVLHQNLIAGKLSVAPLLSMHSATPVAAAIKRGQIPTLSSELNRQQALLNQKKGALIQALMESVKNGN